MIEVYSSATPNGHGLRIMLERAVMRGVEVLADRRKPLLDDETRDAPFGSTRYARH